MGKVQYSWCVNISYTQIVSFHVVGSCLPISTVYEAQVALLVDRVILVLNIHCICFIGILSAFEIYLLFYVHVYIFLVSRLQIARL